MTREEIVERLGEIKAQGWIPSGRSASNVGSVGNTLEDLFNIIENNYPYPNAGEWELKTQRANTSSLITLFHREPEPRRPAIVPHLLLRYYGWEHQTIDGESSFRSTTPGNRYTDRGFRIVVDHQNQQVKFTFDATKVSPRHSEWLAKIERTRGLGPLRPEPFWSFDVLDAIMHRKFSKIFFVIVQTSRFNGIEHFRYDEAYVLINSSLRRFLRCIEDGIIQVDFDARTGHNHGTKFRLMQNHWIDLYDTVDRVM